MNSNPIVISRSSFTTTNNDVLALPDDLRQQLTSALFNSPSSIPAIQTALVSAFQSSGFSDHLEQYILDLLRQDPQSVPSEGQILELVIQKLRQSLKEETGAKGEARASGGQGAKRGSLQIPQEVLDKGRDAVKKEMKDSLKEQIEDDEEDWT